MAAQGSSNLASQIFAHLAAKSLPPKQPWLASFLATQRPTTPLPALKQTALFRLLASDITTSLQSTAASTFPQDILDVEATERRLAGPIPVQVLDIQDIGRSRWSQVEALEAAERGETTKGREVIRVVPGEEGLSDPDGAGGGGPHKLLLQDARGERAYAFELQSVDGVDLGMSIGAKIVLENVALSRGLLLLEPGNTTVLGGKIDELHKQWKENRKEELKTAARAGNEA